MDPKVADAEDAAWIKQKVAELDALFRMGAARTPYQPKPAAPCKEEPAAIVAAKKLCSREIRELIPVLVLTREQMDSRRAGERAEIMEAAKVG
jgi:hypothetical protein